jgi:intein-encoded DNA endonuclease-like protein
MPSNLQLLIDSKLGYPVERWISNAVKNQMTYRQMVEALYDETGVKVSKSSLHLWWTK